MNESGVDFCASCGDYIRWEPTGYVSAVSPTAPPPASPPETPAPAPPQGSAPPPPAEAAPPPAVPPTPPAPDAVMLTLRLPEQDSATGGPVLASIDAGARLMLRALVRNQSGVVDNYELRVKGLPDGWWTIAPSTVYLVPYGSAGAYEQEVDVVLHPPRAPEAEARPWELEVVAESKAHERQVGQAPATLTIRPYTQIEADLKPERAAGRRAATFETAVTNRANARTAVDLAAVDDEGACEFAFASQQLAVDPGQTARSALTVRPPKQVWIGRPLDRRFQLTAQTAGAAAAETPPPVPHMATFRQRPWLPWWLAVVAPLLLLLGILFLLTRPSTVEVPDLTKAQGTLAVQRTLDEAKLTLNPKIVEKAAPAARPGAVIAQSPPAGEEVDEGSAVTIQVAVAPGGGPKVVPDLTGQTPGQADQTLREEELTLGAVSPQPPDLQGEIASQIPLPRTKVKAGTVVNVFSAVPKEGGAGAEKVAAPKPPKGVAVAPGAVAKAAGVAAGSIVIPSVAGQDAENAMGTISDEKLVPRLVATFAPAKPGQAVGTLPAAGTEVAQGADIQVLVSAGYPRVAYDADGDVALADGGTGKRIGTVAKGPSPELDPAWAPDGRRLVFRGGKENTRLFLVDTSRKGAAPRPLTAAADNLRDPTFAPVARGDVLAAISRKEADGDLCFLTLAAPQPSCIREPDWNLASRIAWAPDGRSLLVAGIRTGGDTAQGNTFGLLEYKSAIPFSASAADWGRGTPVTDVTTPNQGVIAAAFSPDGKQVAVVSNLESPSRFGLLLTKPGDWQLASAKALPVAACDVSWRPDGAELLITQFQAGCDPNLDYVIARLDPALPRQASTVVVRGGNPAWQPRSLDAATR
jgi:beta-lactam-binding protein with PASTA domain